MADTTPSGRATEKVVEKPITPAVTAPAANARGPTIAPPGYKIVKVRKPDGTIVLVKRPIDPSVLNKTTAATTDAATPAPSASAAAPKETTNRPSVEASSPAAQETAAKTTPVTENNKPQRQPKPAKPATPRKSTTTTEPEKAAAVAAMASTPKDVATAQPPAYTPGPVTTAVLEVAPSLGLLARFGRHTSRVAGAFIPDLDIGEWEHGDEFVSDMADSDDEGDDDDGDYDDRDDRSHENDTLNGQSQSQGGALNEKQNGNSAASAAATYMLNGMSQIPQRQNIASQQTRPGPTVQMDKNGFVVQDKEIRNDSAPLSELKPPRQLSRRPDWTRYVIWGIMIILPLLFIILGILTAVATGRPQGSALGQGVTQALKVGVSAWPIIFAAVAAQSLRAFATYKVERGIRLMTLEQLISSNSVASSFKQPFVLRRFDWVTLALFALWSLSPLAGQAMVRVSYIGTSITTSNISIPYVDTTYKNLFYGPLPQHGLSITVVDWSQAIDRLFTAGFLPKGVNQSLTMDVWNYPLIPVFEELKSTPDSQGWTTVNPTSDTNFSSIYGIPMVFWDSKNQSEYSFNISSAYMRLKCASFQEKTMGAINATTPRMGSSASGTLWIAFNAWNGSQPGNVTFASKIRRDTTNSSTASNDTEIYAYSTCNFTQTFVDSQLFCTGNLCTAVKMRLTPTNSTEPYYAPMGDLGAPFLAAQGNGYGQSGILTDTEQYIYSPASVDKEKKDNYDLSVLPLNVFTQRFGLLLNSFWMLGFAPPYQTGGLEFDPSFAPQANIYNKYMVSVNLANGTRTDKTDTYTTSWGWLAALLGSGVILLLAGVASVIWDSRTIVPDILGFASSVARKSRYVDLPRMDSAMGGAERSRLLGDVRVMMQDVKPGNEVGRVALGTAHGKAARLRKDRLYR